LHFYDPSFLKSFLGVHEVHIREEQM
jgi:hypothetical protein